MIRFLILRPIAVLTTFSVLLVFGLISLVSLPISLLPNIDVPEIVIKTQCPNMAAGAIEENVLKPIRERLSTLASLTNIESVSTNHVGMIYLKFEYGTQMDLAYVDVSENLDRITNLLPKDIPKPQVVRMNTSDIAIIHIQVVPKYEGDYFEVSELTDKVIKKRIEQIDGVSLVEINGIQQEVITIAPNSEQLSALGLSENEIIQAIRESNKELGTLTVKDGQYKYFVKVANRLQTIDDIKQIPIRLNNSSISLSQLAEVRSELQAPTGIHLFNGKKGLVIAVHKQSNSRMNEIVPKISEAITLFKKDYNRIDFQFSRDQTFILNAGINNLYQDVVYGGILCILLLFMFLGNYASPIIMSICIPLSLIITFIFFKLFNISLNIISLSGLALGVGLLIDNSIIVLDNITRKQRSGYTTEESCVVGVNEVVVPVVSQVLTTVAVYAPLIFLSGLAGALVYDQAIALTISLSVSLLIAFCLNPVLYKLFLGSRSTDLKQDTIIYKWISKQYHRMIARVFKRKKLFFLITCALMPIGIIIAIYLPLDTLPTIGQDETLVLLDWNEPIDIYENEKRTVRLMEPLNGKYELWESDIGIKQFLMQKENNTIQSSEIYLKTDTEAARKIMDELIRKRLNELFPKATFIIKGAPNAFTQLFEDPTPYFEARLRPLGNEADAFNGQAKSIAQKAASPISQNGLGFIEDKMLELRIDNEMLAVYKVDTEQLQAKLQKIFGQFVISEIKRFGDVKIISLKTESNIEDKLRTTVTSTTGKAYPINTFLSYSFIDEAKFITADKAGPYKSILFSSALPPNTINSLKESIQADAAAGGVSVEFNGKFFENKILLKEMFIIFCVCVLLLFFVLAVQFENFIHPMIVMLTMPLGIAGSMGLLLITGGTLNIMAAIGFIVVLGIIVDDPILKIETINRLLKKASNQAIHDRAVLENAIHEAGEICLKPLLLTSLTTSLALLPILFTGGIGSDLQRPMVWVIAGGLTIGTFFTLWFIPIAYWVFTKKEGRRV